MSFMLQQMDLFFISRIWAAGWVWQNKGAVGGWATLSSCWHLAHLKVKIQGKPFRVSPKALQIAHARSAAAGGTLLSQNSQQLSARRRYFAVVKGGSGHGRSWID